MHEIILITPKDPKDNKNRRREMAGVFAAAICAVIVTSIVLSYIGVESFIFFALVNVNILLLLLVLFVVIRNGVKLMLDRRQKVFGSRLRTRLALVFMVLSLAPTVLMFIVGARFVQTSLDYWFRGKVETSVEMAMEVGQAFFDSAISGLDNAGVNLQRGLKQAGIAPGDKGMDDMLKTLRISRGLDFAAYLTPERRLFYSQTSPEALAAWDLARSRFSWDAPGDRNAMKSLLQTGQERDYAFAVFPLSGGSKGYIALGKNLGPGILFKLDRIATGLDEYRELKALKKPFRATFYFILALIALIITFGAMWFGLRLAKEITAPVLALAGGTERIARGDLSVRFEDSGTDEFSVLVHAFNRMTSDLEQSREKLTSANAELALRNREMAQHNHYIETVLDTIEAGVLSLDENNCVNTANKAACALLGEEKESLIGRRMEDLFKDEAASMIQGMLQHFKDNPQSRWQHHLPLGTWRERKVLVTVAGLSTSRGAYRRLVVVMEDVTELEKMQRMAAWREVARRIAHEIKNPLTPIKLSAQRLQRKFGAQTGDPVFAQCTQLIVNQVEHLQQMVTEFSSFAKLPEVELKQDHLEPLLQELIALFRHSHSRIEWTLEIANQLPAFPMDRGALARAFMNLLTNAAEVLESEREKTGVERKDSVRVSARLEENRKIIHVEVADNGPGLTDEERSRAFEPYFSRKKGGTGLGLTIVRSIITDHRGYVRALGAPGAGTIISIDLPLD